MDLSPKTFQTNWRPLVVVLSLALAVVFCPACSNQPVEPQAAVAPPAVPVVVATAIQKTVPVELRVIGNVEAYSTVSVKAQVAAEISQAFFKEGQDVKQGDLLFKLDSRPFEAELQQLEANLARDQAQLENAEAQAERYTKLFQDGIVSQEQYDTFRTSADALRAALRAAQAAIERVRIDLGYCTIRAPISGRTGSLLVHPGNIVKANETVLVVINQIQPIYASFSVPEESLAEIKKHRAHGPLKVRAIIPEDSGPLPEGVLSFIDNTVDRATGTIKLKATFANADSRLWPGQFVNVVLNLTTRHDAVVVPSRAVQTGQAGQYLFVIKPDMTAESRPIVAGDTMGGETVVEKGLQAGEKVVTDGQLRLAPGVKVEAKSATEGT